MVFDSKTGEVLHGLTEDGIKTADEVVSNVRKGFFERLFELLAGME